MNESYQGFHMQKGFLCFLARVWQKMLAPSDNASVCSNSIANRQLTVGVGNLIALQVPGREGDRCEDQRARGRAPVRGETLFRRGRSATVRRTHALCRTHRDSRVRQVTSNQPRRASFDREIRAIHK